MIGSYPASLRNVGGSTKVPVCALKNARRSTWCLPSPVKLGRRQMTYTVSVWRKTQIKKLYRYLLNACIKYLILSAIITHAFIWCINHACFIQSKYYTCFYWVQVSHIFLLSARITRVSLRASITRGFIECNNHKDIYWMHDIECKYHTCIYWMHVSHIFLLRARIMRVSLRRVFIDGMYYT
jgi:hypothetical protein